MPTIPIMPKVFRLFVHAGLVTVAGASLMLPAAGQSGGAGESAWAFGGGLTVLQKGYRSIERDVLPLPLISYESPWISASVPTLDVKLYNQGQVSLRWRSRYVRDGYHADESPFLAGMVDRKAGLWTGGALIWRPGRATVTLDVLHDISAYSKGMRSRLQLERRYSIGAFGVTPRLAGEWVDRNYVDYYYGVRAPEVRAERAFYQGRSSTNVEAGARIDYSIARQHSVFVDLRSSHFGHAIKESPLVARAGNTGISIGYLYRY